LQVVGFPEATLEAEQDTNSMAAPAQAFHHLAHMLGRTAKGGCANVDVLL
jgi:hypothetical protein